MKEAAGAVTGAEEKKAEGRAQQRKGRADEEAAQRAQDQAGREGSQGGGEGARQAEAQGQGAAGWSGRHPLETLERRVR